MKNLHVLLFLFLPVMLVGTASANTYINEDFEDGVAFDHAPGTSTDPTTTTMTATGGAVDFYDTDGPDVNNPTSVAWTGSISTERALSGVNSLELTAGEGFTVSADPDFDCPDCERNIFQIAVSLAAVSEPAGTVLAEFRQPWTNAVGGLNYSFYWQLVADGVDGADIVAGQDGANPTAPTTIGHVSAMDVEWVLVTFTYQRKGAITDPDLVSLPSGAQFFAASDTPGLAFDTADDGATGDPTFSVLAGRVFVDDVYWELGLDAADISAGARNLQVTTVPATLSEFNMD